MRCTRDCEAATAEHGSHERGQVTCQIFRGRSEHTEDWNRLRLVDACGHDCRFGWCHPRTSEVGVVVDESVAQVDDCFCRTVVVHQELGLGFGPLQSLRESIAEVTE